MKIFYRFSVCIILVSFFSFCRSNQSANCEDLKRGKFHYSFSYEHKIVHLSIVRNDSIEIQTDLDSGYFFKYKIEWTDKCKYSLTTLETNKNLTNRQIEIAKSKILHNRIVDISDNYYISAANINDSPKEIIDTIWVDK